MARRPWRTRQRPRTIFVKAAVANVQIPTHQIFSLIVAKQTKPTKRSKWTRTCKRPRAKKARNDFRNKAKKFCFLMDNTLRDTISRVTYDGKGMTLALKNNKLLQYPSASRYVDLVRGPSATSTCIFEYSLFSYCPFFFFSFLLKQSMGRPQ